MDNLDIFEDMKPHFGSNTFSLQKLDKKMDLLMKKMDILEDKIQNIESILTNDISKKCDKMESHIDFIDNVYTSVQKPLGYLCGKVNSMVGFGGSNTNIRALPDIENKDT